MPKYTVEITDIEDKAMSFIAVEVQNWIDTAVTERARRAKADILELNMKHCNANGIAIAENPDKQLEQAFSLGVVKALKDVSDSPGRGE